MRRSNRLVAGTSTRVAEHDVRKRVGQAVTLQQRVPLALEDVKSEDVLVDPGGLRGAEGSPAERVPAEFGAEPRNSVRGRVQVAEERLARRGVR